MGNRHPLCEHTERWNALSDVNKGLLQQEMDIIWILQVMHSKWLHQGSWESICHKVPWWKSTWSHIENRQRSTVHIRYIQKYSEDSGNKIRIHTEAHAWGLWGYLNQSTTLSRRITYGWMILKHLRMRRNWWNTYSQITSLYQKSGVKIWDTFILIRILFYTSEFLFSIFFGNFNKKEFLNINI